MFKMLIIDDDPDRKNTLSDLFNHSSYELYYIFEKNKFFENASDFSRYDCIAVDISLDNWIDDGDTKNMFNTVISTIGKTIPIVLFSSKIQEIIFWTNKLLEEKYNLLYTIALREITEDKKVGKKLKSEVESSQIICNNIFTLLKSRHNYSSLVKQPNEDINILHISDLQFGDPHLNQDLSNSFVGSLRRAITDKTVPQIDFIAITGDVAYDGSPSQYEKAYLWITNLCKNILGSNFHDRIWLIPGNHDTNLSLCALNYYKYYFPKNNNEEGKIIFAKRDEKSTEYSLFSIDPFRDFAFKLTRDNSWIKNESISFINDRLPEKQLGYRKAKFELNEDEINKLRNDLLRSPRNNSLPSIIIIHSSPKHLGYDMEEEHKNNWTSIANFFIEANAKLYIFGHRHKNLNEIDISLNSIKKMKLCGTGTLLCRPDEGDTRGFKIINIKRKMNIIYEYNTLKFNYKNDATIKIE